MMATMGQALVGVVAQNIAKNQERKVLVVGFRGDNFPPRYRNHPQLVFWQTEGRVSAENIPVGTGLVLTTKFIDHPLYDGLARVCAERNIVFGIRRFGTGEIKTILAPFVDGIAQASKEDTTVVAATTATVERKQTADGKLGRGVLKNFVLTHGDINADVVTHEAKRLEAIAHAQGLTSTTWGAIGQAIRDIRRGSARRGGKTEAAPKVTAPPKPKAALAALDGDDQTIIQMLDDMAAAVALVKQEVLKRSEKRHQLKELLKSL